MAGWKRPPPVIILSGNEGFLRRRELSKAIGAARSTGRMLERVEGEDYEALSELVSGGMFGEKTLCIVTKPAKVDVDIIKQLLEDGDGTVCLVLHHEGKIRKGSVLDKLEVAKRHHIVFNRPDQKYKLGDYATKFVVLEAKRLGIVMPTDLAEALVGKVGTDLGVLHFELVKVEAYMGFKEAGLTVTPKLLMATMVRTGEADIAPLVEALGNRDLRRVLREATQIQENFAGDEAGRTLAVCAWIGSAATRWLHAAALHADGASVDEAASRMKMHAYVYKTITLPPAKRWGRGPLTRLVKKISRVEMAVRRGHISPWTELECMLADACRAVRAGG